MPSLAEQHRQQQIALRAITLRELLRVWPAFDITDIDRTWPAVQQALTALIWLRHAQSSQLAAAYYQRARQAAGIGTIEAVLAAAPPLEQIDVALTHVGPVGAKRLLALGRTDAADQTLVKVSGTVGRLVLNGGRNTLLETAKADPRRVGWRRITSGKPCEFCSMLAGRGAVYREETGDFAAHDHCSCSAAPVFGEARAVREFTPSQRQISSEGRRIRNERVRAFIEENR